MADPTMAQAAERLQLLEFVWFQVRQRCNQWPSY